MAYELGAVDLNVQPASTYVSAMVEYQDRLFFGTAGGLYSTDGTEEGTVRVHDVSVIDDSIIVSGDFLYFVGSGSYSSRKLWRTDGTAEGTVVVSDTLPAYPYNAEFLVDVNGTLFFVEGFVPNKLYKLDATAGATLLRDFSPLGFHTRIADLTDVDGTLFFTVNPPLTAGARTQVWRSDGTENGTILLSEFNGSTELVKYRGQLYFRGIDEQNGSELWRSDGTVAGTKLVLNTVWGNSSGAPTELTVVGETLYFVVEGNTLWKYDGTPEGTGAVANVGSVSDLIAGPDVLYFRKPDVDELWRSDGTTAGTYFLKDRTRGWEPRTVVGDLVVAGGLLYFVGYEENGDAELWKSDGTTAGTVRVKDINPGPASSDPQYLTAAAGKVFFRAMDHRGIELWLSDGSAEGTAVVKEIAFGTASSSPEKLVRSEELVYFTANAGEGDRLWRTDGSPEGTFPIDPGAWVQRHYAVNEGTLYFSDYRGVWKSDGTLAGTHLVKALSGFFGPFYAVGSLVYFTVRSHGSTHLWRTDGTEAGTFSLKEVYVSNTTVFQAEVADVNGIAYFGVHDPASGFELWKSDGTVAGTARVRDVLPGSGGSAPERLTNLNGRLVFLARNASGAHVWSSDGTDAGTHLLSTGDLRVIRTAGDKLYFTKRTSRGERVDELWTTDGTPAGTRFVKALPVFGWSSTADFNGTLFWTQRSDDGVHSLWQSDGTSEGTLLTMPLGRFTHTELVVHNGYLYLGRDDGIRGSEVWRSDGREAGTVLVADVNPGRGGSFPRNLVPVGNRLYFGATDSLFGGEIRFLETRANTPSVANAIVVTGVQSPGDLVVSRHLADGSETSHLKVTGIIGGTLYLNDGVRQVSEGQFVLFDEAAKGFKFTPDEGFIGTARFMVQASTSASDEGLGGEAVKASITVLEGLGTVGDDNLTLRASSDGMSLEVYTGNPPAPGSDPLFTWPMDANVTLPIDTLGGRDAVFVELPPGTEGPAGGGRFVGNGGADDLHVLSGQLRLAGGTSVVAGLTVDDAATLDIGDSSLVIDYTGTSPVATVREKILSGRGGPGFGAGWNGAGITSSAAAQGNANEPEAWSVGYAENGALPLGAYANFRGVEVDETAVLIAYTRTGDANLDGVVDDQDVTIVSANYAPGVPNANWAMGDFDYNGFVDDGDATLLGAFYEPGVAAAPPVRGGGVRGEGLVEETFGREVVRGRETRAQQASELVRGRETRAQQGTEYEVQSTECKGRNETDEIRNTKPGEGDALIELLAGAIAAEADWQGANPFEMRLVLRPEASDGFRFWSE